PSVPSMPIIALRSQSSSARRISAALLLALLLGINLPAQAVDPFGGSGATPGLIESQNAFLPVEQAYRLEPAFINGDLVLHWEIAAGYYLYRHQFAFRGGNGNALPAALPAGITKEDEYFGRVEAYYREVEATLGQLPAAP